MVELNGEIFPTIGEDDEVENYCFSRRYGIARKNYLAEQAESSVEKFIVCCGSYDKDIMETDKEALKLEEELMERFMKEEGVTEELKKADQMEWVRQYNNIKNRVVEIVQNELIFV